MKYNDKSRVLAFEPRPNLEDKIYNNFNNPPNDKMLFDTQLRNSFQYSNNSITRTIINK